MNIPQSWITSKLRWFRFSFLYYFEKRVFASVFTQISLVDFYEIKILINSSSTSSKADLTEAVMQFIWLKEPELTKRAIGRIIEINRMSANKDYYDFTNLVFAYYWCTMLRLIPLLAKNLRKFVECSLKYGRI